MIIQYIYSADFNTGRVILKIHFYPFSNIVLLVYISVC